MVLSMLAPRVKKTLVHELLTASLIHPSLGLVNPTTLSEIPTWPMS